MSYDNSNLCYIGQIDACQITISTVLLCDQLGFVITLAFPSHIHCPSCSTKMVAPLDVTILPF